MTRTESQSSTIRIDAEVHLMPPEWCRPDYQPPPGEERMRRVLYEHPERDLALPRATVEGLYEELERCGIDGAVILGLPWMDVEMNRSHNDYIANIVRHDPDRFIGIGVTPPPDRCDVLEEIAWIHDQGLEGVKVIPTWQRFHLDDREFEPALDEMERRGLALMPHTDQAYLPPEVSDPPHAVFEVARRHPELRILAPHLAGGLALNALHPPVEEVLKNVLFVGSVPTTMRMVEWAVQAVGADRVAFGSDYPFNPSHDQEAVAQAFEELDLTDEQRAAVWGRNVRRFFGRDV